MILKEFKMMGSSFFPELAELCLDDLVKLLLPLPHYSRQLHNLA